MPKMAKLDELAHLHIRDWPMLAAISRNKPVNASFHTAHGHPFHRIASVQRIAGPVDYIIITRPVPQQKLLCTGQYSIRQPPDGRNTETIMSGLQARREEYRGPVNPGLFRGAGKLGT
jgi:hypothetical protein